MYSVKKLDSALFSVTNMENYNTYTVTKNNNKYTCDCMGFGRQHDKSQHKHCLMVKALEEMEDYDSFLLDDNNVVIDAHSIIEELDYFVEEVMKS